MHRNDYHSQGNEAAILWNEVTLMERSDLERRDLIPFKIHTKDQSINEWYTAQRRDVYRETDAIAQKPTCVTAYITCLAGNSFGPIV